MTGKINDWKNRAHRIHRTGLRQGDEVAIDIAAAIYKVVYNPMGTVLEVDITGLSCSIALGKMRPSEEE